MPAPQASMMKQLARVQFASFQLKVPEGWQQPQGDPAARHYSDAFKPSEKQTAPVVASPPLVIPHTMNKYHTDTQKMIHAKFGSFIDGICEAICSAWSTWQSAATLMGVTLPTAPLATGGQVVGPPLTPLILAQGPKSSPQELKYTTAIANVIGNSFIAYTGGMKVPGLPWYPMLAACPSPMAPPTPNKPDPVKMISFAQTAVSKNAMKPQMIAALGDPTAQYHKELFDSICHAFESTVTSWEGTTMVTNVMVTVGPVPTMATPVPAPGPVVGGLANMTPGGFA